MPPPLLAELFIASAWGLVGVVLTLAAVRWRTKRSRHARFLALHLGPTSQSDSRTAVQLNPRLWATALGTRFGTRSAASFERVALLIDSTSMAGRITPAEILGWKLLLTAGGLLSGLALLLASSSLSLLLLPVLIVGGWFGPTLWLKYLRRVRLAQIVRDLPTIIDLLALSLEAGMGLDRAISIICKRSDSPLSDELQHVLNDIALGISRQEAFVRLSARVDSDDVRLLSTSIIQSEQLGSSLVTTVRNQARLLRVARRRRAETQALKAPVKMLIPMALFILPTLFLVILGPPALNLSRAFGQ